MYDTYASTATTDVMHRNLLRPDPSIRAGVRGLAGSRLRAGAGRPAVCLLRSDSPVVARTPAVTMLLQEVTWQ